VEPLETPLGIKRRINQSTCNQDYSCVDGYCPSFVTLDGDVRKRQQAVAADPHPRADTLPQPAPATLTAPYNLLVTGVGGTGVVTIGALITMAAHLDGHAASVLDFTGFAQKFGPVLSYIRLADKNDKLHQLRIEAASSDALIGCDAVVSTSPKALHAVGTGTRVVLNTAEMPTGDIVLARNTALGIDQRADAIASIVGDERLNRFNANQAASTLLGDTVFANMIMLGHAWQVGLVPVSLTAMQRAIELNGVAIDKNLAAFAWGRLLSHSPQTPGQLLGDSNRVPGANRELGEPQPLNNEQLLALHAKRLTAYQNARYARRFTKLLKPAIDRINSLTMPNDQATALIRVTAQCLYQFMATKDEYEVARLQTDPAFLTGLRDKYDGNWQLQYHFASPLISWRRDHQGRPVKRTFGTWLNTPLRVLAGLRFVRGTWFDPFSFTGERRDERQTLKWFEQLLQQMAGELNQDNAQAWLNAMRAARQIRGFGPVKAAALATNRARIDSILNNPAEATMAGAGTPPAQADAANPSQSGHRVIRIESLAE
jgi:indolepyruvate ferredoxin oxidoreductase